MKKNKIFKAAKILTSLFERNKKFMSHFPYRIIHHLKVILDYFDIFSSDLNKIYKKFNPNISF